MTPLHTPKPTRSPLQNRRNNRAVRAAALHESPGLRLAGRRTALPPARRAEVVMAVAGSLIIFLTALLTVAQ
ncbi:hypothetical protein [Lewinella sp. IMCC34183]|uniref:hypothetical protein n=1 Tax=Lewinella sp. IMCC34183 TaxID=2248762 RepID=UPI000E250935|nr:hypothetical protein [Lewinella sp. IMCC34183]